MVVGRPDCRIDYGSNHREGRIRWAESKNLLPVAIPISRFLDPGAHLGGCRTTLRYGAAPATEDFQRL